MTARRRQRAYLAGRAGLLVLLLAGCLLSCGCVYWRLMKVRHQLARFETHFEVSHDPGPLILFTKPVLKGGDLAWLTGFRPEPAGDEGRYADGNAYIFTKRDTPESDPEKFRTLRIYEWLKNDRVVSFEFPEQFKQIINQELMERAFKGIEEGEFDGKKEKAGWQLSGDLKIPSREELIAVMGAPVRNESTTLHDVLFYAYDQEEAPRPLPEGSTEVLPDVSANFLYDRKEDRMIQAHLVVGHLVIFVARGGEGRYAVTLRREVRTGK